MLEEVLHNATVAFGALLIAVLGVLLRRLGDYVTSRIHNESVAACVRRLDDLALRVVKDVYQSYVAPLKDGDAWDTNSQMRAKESALRAMRSYLGPKGLQELEKVFGLDGSVNELLGTFVESAVHDNKRDGESVTWTPPQLPARGAPIGPVASRVVPLSPLPDPVKP